MKLGIFSFEKSVGAVVFRRAGEERLFLLLRYGYERGHWGLPKGHMEKGESEEQTLRRELEEETGLKEIKIVPDFRARQMYSYIAKDTERAYRKEKGRGFWIFKKVHYYLAATNASEIKLSKEHSDFAWLPYEDAVAKITYRGDRKILEKFYNFLEEVLLGHQMSK